MTADPVPLFGPEMHADPYPMYRTLREADPVHWSEQFNAWVLTRYDDVAVGLNDLRLSSDRVPVVRQIANNPELEPYFSFLERRMLQTDPPKHTRLRKLVSKAFTPHAVEAMRPHIQQLVDGLLDRVQGGGRMEVIGDLAFPVPATVITEMLGVRPEDRDQLKRWSDDIIIYFSTHPANITAEQYRQAMRSTAETVEYFRAALARARAEGRPCLIQALAQAEADGDRLTDDEVIANANLLLVAGHETTTNLIGNGLLALLRNPDQMAKLRADPSLVPGAVEELLRYDGPVQFTQRMAREDVTIGGRTIRRGQFVILFLAAANRDPAHFPDPDQLDLTRASHKHLSFGLGHHFCLGAPLARLEGQIAFTTILRRLPNLRLVPGPLEYREGFNPRALKALPVAFG